MRSHLEFRSSALNDLVDDQHIDLTPRGEKVAKLLSDGLREYGFEPERIHAEDWGWRVQVANDAFPLWVGCGRYEDGVDGHLCFIEPSKPFVRRWLRRIATSDTVDRLATALEEIVRNSGKAHDLRWWTVTEAARR